MEGPSSFSKEKESLIANVLVYDNHVEFARQLKVREKDTNFQVTLTFQCPGTCRYRFAVLKVADWSNTNLT